VAQVVEHLSNKPETPSSNTNATKKKKKKMEEGEINYSDLAENSNYNR
jgi:hypothetical protein